MKGKKHIIQMIVGDMTQYLTTVQGMPLHIEKRLTAITKNFLWNNVPCAPVNMNTLYLPIKDGGLGILNLEAWNEVIELMWLAKYMALGER